MDDLLSENVEYRQFRITNMQVTKGKKENNDSDK